MLHRTQDLSSWTRDPTLAACSRTTGLYGVSLNQGSLYIYYYRNNMIYVITYNIIYIIILCVGVCVCVGISSDSVMETSKEQGWGTYCIFSVEIRFKGHSTEQSANAVVITTSQKSIQNHFHICGTLTSPSLPPIGWTRFLQSEFLRAGALLNCPQKMLNKISITLKGKKMCVSIPQFKV